MSAEQDMTFDEWQRIGLLNNWCGPTVCITHDGLPTTSTEDTEFEEGDPCVHIVRLYADRATKKAVEANHSPSVWRQPRS